MNSYRKQNKTLNVDKNRSLADCSSQYLPYMSVCLSVWLSKTTKQRNVTLSLDMCPFHTKCSTFASVGIRKKRHLYLTTHSTHFCSVIRRRTYSKGGIAPNQVIARSEFEVHREMFTE